MAPAPPPPQVSSLHATVAAHETEAQLLRDELDRREREGRAQVMPAPD